MNLLSDLLNGSPLVDQAASLPAGITLQWLADNAEGPWSAAVTAASGLPAAPPLTSILSRLATHPLNSYVIGSYLPVIRAGQWLSDFAAPPDAPAAFEPEDWVEFLPGASGDHGVIVPEFASADYELALFSWTSWRMPYSSPGLPPSSVIVGLGRRLRGRGVTVYLSPDGCSMSTTGLCVSDEDCPSSCEKRQHTGRLGPGVRCACAAVDPASRVIQTAATFG
jgi:hypothetical protein